MLNRLFPKQIDNAYRGHWLAIWILVVVAGMKSLQSVMTIINTRDVLMGPDAIPLDTYSAAAQDTTVAIGALLGMSLLVVPLLSFLSVVRYRTMIPLMFLLLLATQLGSRITLGLYPIARIASPEMGFAGHSIGFYINLFLLAVTMAGFVLSLTQRDAPQARTIEQGKL